MRNLQIPAQRQQQILDYIKKNQGANIKELASHLGVSEAAGILTIWRRTGRLKGLTAVQCEGRRECWNIHMI